MITETPVASEPVSESLNSVAAALRDAADAVGEGAADAAGRVKSALPETRNVVSEFVYSTFYYASYGVVFPTLYLAHVVPGLGPVASGLADGGNDACERVRGLKEKRAT